MQAQAHYPLHDMRHVSAKIELLAGEAKRRMQDAGVSHGREVGGTTGRAMLPDHAMESVCAAGKHRHLHITGVVHVESIYHE